MTAASSYADGLDTKWSDYAAAGLSLDTALATGPYGDCLTLAADKASLYDGLAWIHADHLHGLRRAEGLGPVWDMYRRARIDALHGPTTAVPLLSAGLVDHLEDAGSALREIRGGPACLRCLTSWDHPLWADALRVLQGVLRISDHGEAISGYAPDERDLASASRALGLVADVLPRISVNTFPLTSTVLVVRTRIPSMYSTQLPETIQLGDWVLAGDTVTLAESLLHESLHEKFTVLRLTRQLTAPGYRDSTSPRVVLPWSVTRESRRAFPVARSLSTLHVYTHLTGFYMALLGRPENWLDEAPLHLRKRALANYARAAFLLQELRTTRCEEHLGPDGVRLRDWLDQILTDIRETPGSLNIRWRTWGAESHITKAEA